MSPVATELVSGSLRCVGNERTLLPLRGAIGHDAVEGNPELIVHSFQRCGFRVYKSPWPSCLLFGQMGALQACWSSDETELDSCGSAEPYPPRLLLLGAFFGLASNLPSSANGSHSSPTDWPVFLRNFLPSQRRPRPSPLIYGYNSLSCQCL